MIFELLTIWIISIGGDALEDSSSNDCADARKSVGEPLDSVGHENRNINHNEKGDERLKIKHDEEESAKRANSVPFDDAKEDSIKSLGKYAPHSCWYSKSSNKLGFLLLKYLNNAQNIIQTARPSLTKKIYWNDKIRNCLLFSFYQEQ